MSLSAFPRKILLTRKIFFNFLSAPNVAPKPSASAFHFRPSLNIKGTLMLRAVHIRKKKLTD